MRFNHYLRLVTHISGGSNMKVMIIFVEKLEGIIIALGQFGANTRFERAVVASLEFFRSHHCRIACDQVLLTMLGQNAEPQIPDTWRNSIISPNPALDVATFYVQTREQIFKVDINRIHPTVNVSLIVSFSQEK